MLIIVDLLSYNAHGAIGWPSLLCTFKGRRKFRAKRSAFFYRSAIASSNSGASSPSAKDGVILLILVVFPTAATHRYVRMGICSSSSMGMLERKGPKRHRDLSNPRAKVPWGQLAADHRPYGNTATSMFIATLDLSAEKKLAPILCLLKDAWKTNNIINAPYPPEHVGLFHRALPEKRFGAGPSLPSSPRGSHSG